MAEWIWLAVALPLLGFLVNGGLSLRRPQAKNLVSGVGVGVLVGAFVVSAAVFLEMWAHPPHQPIIVNLWRWLPVGALQIDMGFQLDQLSAVMLLIVTGVGSLIHVFSVGYMKEDPGYARYFAYLNLFVAFMLVLVLGSSFPVMFIGWEGVGLCSYLLIGFWFSDKVNADAGKKAFIVNRIGDFGFLVAMFMIWLSLGTLTFTGMVERAPAVFAARSGMVTAITLFLFLGCTGKSAQIPLYTWLPDAMAGPTPVSALIHAATMVTAGIYMIARSNALYLHADVTNNIIAIIGAATALLAATIALKQNDIKKVLAYSTVSQLGYMFLALGTGSYVAAVFHVMTHAFFKALLFLGSGSVIHAVSGQQDIRFMGGLRNHMKITYVTFFIGCLAIAGIPPFSGFFSKDAILLSAFEHNIFLYVVGLLTAGLTAFYMFRLLFITFFGGFRGTEEQRHHIHESPWAMTLPLIILAILSVIGGFI